MASQAERIAAAVERLVVGGDDVALETTEEQKAGAFTGDVWFSSGGAELVGNILPKNYVWRFVPDSTAAVTPEEYTYPLLMSRFGTSIFAYISSSPLRNARPGRLPRRLCGESWKPT